MKKVIFGGIMIFAGVISTAVLISSINIDVVVNGALSLSEAISFYNLTMPLVMFIIIAVVGFAIGVWGLVEKDK